jgi:predicted ATP-binding protein involved in virulence
MDNPLEGPAVCLVDEIDLHLHPKWQRKITGFLSERFPNTQFIATAHSPLVVQSLPDDANVAVLKRSEDTDDTGAHYVEIHNDMQPLRNLRVDQMLTSDLYGLTSARPPEVEDLMEERKQLLAQSELSEADRERLEELEERLGPVSFGETQEEREAMDFMRRVADRLGMEEGQTESSETQS